MPRTLLPSPRAFALLASLLLPAAHAADEPVLTVNGISLNARDVASFTDMRANQGERDVERGKLMQELVNRELLYQEALAKGYDKKPEVAADIQNQRRTLLAEYMAYVIAKDTQPTDEVVKNFYQQNVAGHATKEYRTRHIVVDSEAKAKDIITALDKGGDFAKLATEQGEGPSANNGGDVGWMSLGQMLQPVADAVALLEKNAYTKTPVETRYGWHVIRLDDARDVPAPPIEELRDQIRGLLQQKAVSEHIAKLRAQAKIKISQPK